ncbi:hypothetical protein ACFSSA_08835 [Luteolibacter algae]|uniref:Uncharacterized protein n=2 Tax=Luteolibacter algae TaxID=454151 RepID=A0ABW5D6P4_9BACT
MTHENMITEQPGEVRAAIFFVREHQWEDFVAMMTDSDSNFESWNEWKAAVDRMTLRLSSDGVTAIRVDVDLNEFQSWCKRNGTEMNGQSRARYATEAINK